MKALNLARRPSLGSLWPRGAAVLVPSIVLPLALWLPQVAAVNTGDRCDGGRNIACEQAWLANPPQATSVRKGLELASLDDYVSRERLQAETNFRRDREMIALANPPSRIGSQVSEMETLRQELATEREERQRLVAELRSLQEQGSKSRGGSGSEAVALRARLIEIESRQQDDLNSLARAVSASRKHEDALAAKLAALSAETRMARAESNAPASAAVAGGAASPVEDYGRLRSLLDEERLQNARLNAKLKLASRATDLIFRLRTQGPEEVQEKAQPAPAPVEGQMPQNYEPNP